MSANAEAEDKNDLGTSEEKKNQPNKEKGWQLFGFHWKSELKYMKRFISIDL